jgi:hypothetical protein
MPPPAGLGNWIERMMPATQLSTSRVAEAAGLGGDDAAVAVDGELRVHRAGEVGFTTSCFW